MATDNNYNSSWNLYTIWHDEKPGIITLDLGWKNALPVPELPHLAIITLIHQDETADGFISKEESKRLAPIEDMIIDKVLASQQSEHVAFFTYDGARRLIFYISEAGKFEPLVDGIMQNKGYEYQVSIGENDNWEHYKEFLYPDEYSLQDIHTRNIIRQLEKLEDDGNKPRPIDYTAVFTDKQEAENFVNAIGSKGFQDLSIAATDDNTYYTVEFKKIHEIDFNLLSDNVYEVLDILADYKTGYFNGWGCGVVK